LQDFRIPTNPAPVPANALIPVPPEVFGSPGAQNASNLRIVSYDANGVPIYAAEGLTRAQAQGFTLPPNPRFDIPTPYAQRSITNEVPRQVYEAQKNAELAQEFRAAAERQPTGRGSVLEFDPITGTYKVGGEGVRGATPEIFMSDTGRSLNTATQKIASRQNFALSAEERVAWEKTKVDLAAAVPELKGLSDKAIAGKIMDREWASNAVAKARQQAQAFDEIAQRGATDLARRAAAKQRDLLVDALTTLEEQLRPARPVSSGRQGPKTIEALRKVNKLAPDNQNGLAP
jgi:hypothetical protein